jgi:hypothetical protein
MAARRAPVVGVGSAGSRVCDTGICQPLNVSLEAALKLSILLDNFKHQFNDTLMTDRG